MYSKLKSDLLGWSLCVCFLCSSVVVCDVCLIGVCYFLAHACGPLVLRYVCFLLPYFCIVTFDCAPNVVIGSSVIESKKMADLGEPMCSDRAPKFQN